MALEIGDWGSMVNEQEKLLTEKVSGISINSTESDDSAQSQNAESADDVLPRAEMSLLQKVLRSKLVENNHTLEVQQKDVNSPLYSIKSFEELNLRPELLKGVYDMGFNFPSKIQETALPMLLANPPANMIAQSQSGTGKTAAFVLTVLSRVKPELNHPQVLCLSPTYELALQTGKVIEQMAKHCPDITIKYATKGVEMPRGSKVSEQIVVGTPGKMLDWVTKLRFIDPRNIVMFVLDEADVMIATQGHRDQSIRIHKTLPPNCQMLLFSATYDADVMELAEVITPDAVTIKLKREEQSLDNIKQYYVHCYNQDEKYEALSNIYGGISIGQAIIFCQAKKTTSWLAAKMTSDGHAVAMLSSDLESDQRINVLDRFRQGKEKVLITTNVCARGIDIEQVTVVVNFDLPIDVVKRQPDYDTYLHRIGRTGRFGKSGIAINIVDDDRALKNLKLIEQYFGRSITKLDATDIDEIEKIGQN